MRKRKDNRIPWWSRSGLTLRQESVFRWSSVALVAVMACGWGFAILDTYNTRKAHFTAARYQNGRVVKVISAAEVALAPTRSVLESGSSMAYLNDAALQFLSPLRGESGKLRMTTRTPGEVVAKSDDPHLQAQYTAPGSGPEVSSRFAAPEKPGIYKLAVQVDQATREVENFNVITLKPFDEKTNGRIGLYYLGSWPFEGGGSPKTPAYANPSGFIEVTPENRNTAVSEHFVLGDFLTKDQPNVWPKYVLLRPQLVDKLELVVAEMQKQGVRVQHVRIMSGFRTPRYNSSGGNPGGRAGLSRHMYGDAADIFVDNNRDGATDDVNGDGRVDVRDSEFIAAIAERVEREHPSLTGGIGVYPACCGHGPFTHIDVRGFRARWRGTGSG